MVGVDVGAVDIEMTLQDLGTRSSGWRGSREAELSARCVSRRCVSVSYHPRVRRRSQGRMHVHPHWANARAGARAVSLWTISPLGCCGTAAGSPHTVMTRSQVSAGTQQEEAPTGGPTVLR